MTGLALTEMAQPRDRSGLAVWCRAPRRCVLAIEFRQSSARRPFRLDIQQKGSKVNLGAASPGTPNACLNMKKHLFYIRYCRGQPEGKPKGSFMHRQLAFTDSHAAAIRHTVIRVEKTMGMVKAYFQLKAVTATKQMASAHAMLRTRAKVSA
jgi:hypothetical protein